MLSARRPSCLDHDEGIAECRLDYDLALAPCLLAVDPRVSAVSWFGRPLVRRLSFVKQVRGLLPGDAPFRRMPLQVADGRLLGGLDLAMTLQAGRPVFERGLLADADGGCLVVPMAERLPFAMALRLCSVLDQKEVAVERDGFACRNASRIAVIALDEGVSDDERPPAALLDRLAIHLTHDPRHVYDGELAFDAEEIARAKAHLPRVTVDDATLKAFCHAALAIGISSLRAPMLALKWLAFTPRFAGAIVSGINMRWWRVAWCWHRAQRFCLLCKTRRPRKPPIRPVKNFLGCGARRRRKGRGQLVNTHRRRIGGHYPCGDAS